VTTQQRGDLAAQTFDALVGLSKHAHFLQTIAPSQLNAHAVKDLVRLMLLEPAIKIEAKQPHRAAKGLR
jgi:hypothetical protein